MENSHFNILDTASKRQAWIAKPYRPPSASLKSLAPAGINAASDVQNMLPEMPSFKDAFLP